MALLRGLKASFLLRHLPPPSTALRAGSEAVPLLQSGEFQWIPNLTLSTDEGSSIAVLSIESKPRGLPHPHPHHFVGPKGVLRSPRPPNDSVMRATCYGFSNAGCAYPLWVGQGQKFQPAGNGRKRAALSLKAGFFSDLAVFSSTNRHFRRAVRGASNKVFRAIVRSRSCAKSTSWFRRRKRDFPARRSGAERSPFPVRSSGGYAH